MTMSDRKLFRAAVVIQEQSSRPTPVPETINLPEYSWNHLQRLKHSIARARKRGWYLAAQSLCSDLADACRSLQRELENSLRGLSSRMKPRLPASASAVYLDLRALESEFGGVEIDLKKQELVVTTDTIELDGVLLGEFEIRLHWSQIHQSAQPYRVVALDPHPSARRDDVTHPHVQDEQLCEGEGRAAIAAALAEGRFYDFFLLVNQLLHTYGRGSAFVELSDWGATRCEDCGACIDDGDCYYCNGCNATLCESCSWNCPGCDNSYCSSCLRQCAACGRDFCCSCLVTCSVCRQQCCSDCHENRICTTCYEKLHPKEPENDSSDESPSEATCLAGQGG